MSALDSERPAALSPPQITAAALDEKIWLEGGAGSGKTSAGLARLRQLLAAGVAADSIALFVPQRSLAEPYLQALRAESGYSGGIVRAYTLGSLARQTVETFWFLIAEGAGFAQPQALPNFLSLELVQYFMTRAIEPLVLEREYFHSVRIERARLYSQILDNMNKAALVGFPISEIGSRLKAALGGGIEQAHIFDDAQTCALEFRRYCLAHNLLDFSLYVQLFRERALMLPAARARLSRRFRHVIVDNVEEDNPASHAFLEQLLPGCQSALIIYDSDAGFRRFLGADPENARRLRQYCDRALHFGTSQVMSAGVSALSAQLSQHLSEADAPLERKSDAAPALHWEAHRFHPQMVDWVARQIAELIEERGIKPRDIVVLAPFLSDVLRFSLRERLAKRGIRARSHRPSRALREEPAARALLTLARLAHPRWEYAPAAFDVALALMAGIGGLDFLRAKLLADRLYQRGRLLPFHQLRSAAAQDRITFAIGERYDQLRAWLDAYIEAGGSDAIDIFFRRIFGEVLSRAGFGFYGDAAAGNTAMNLVDSARGFRWSLEFMRRYDDSLDLAADYARMVDRGVIANFYLRDWVAEDEDSVLIAPAYTFLLGNRPVDYQFWLDIGSEAWSRRLYQPLTHPHVLSRGWQPQAVWTDADEAALNRQTLRRLFLALTRRCRRGVYLGYSELSESGYEGRGLLLECIQALLRAAARESADV